MKTREESKARETLELLGEVPWAMRRPRWNVRWVRRPGWPRGGVTGWVQSRLQPGGFPHSYSRAWFLVPRSLSGPACSGSGFRAVAHPAAETPARGVLRINGYLVTRQDSWPFLESESLPPPLPLPVLGHRHPGWDAKCPSPCGFHRSITAGRSSSCLPRPVPPAGRCGPTCSLAPAAADGLAGGG